MRRLLIIELAILASCWTACAFATLYVITSLNAVTLIWLPSGIAAAALFGTPHRRWLPALAVLLVISIPLHLGFGFTLAKSIGYTAATLLCSASAAALGRLVMGRRQLDNLSRRDFAMLFSAAAVGALVSTVIGSLFWSAMDADVIAWWFMANWLGILSIAPVALAIRAKFHWGRRARLATMRLDANFGLLAVFAASLALCWWSLNADRVTSFLIVIAIILAAMKYGQVGSTVAIFAFAVAGTMATMGADARTFLPQYSAREAALILQGFMAINLLLGYQLANFLMAHDRLALRLRARNSTLAQSNEMLAMMAQLGNIGRWQYFPRTGKQIWSGELCQMYGLPKDGQPTRGQRMAAFPDKGEAFFAMLNDHAQDRSPYRVELEMQDTAGEAKVLRLLARNEFDEKGRLDQIFGVITDETDHYRRLARLAEEKGEAIAMAQEAKKLALTDPLTGLPNRRAGMAEIDNAILQDAKFGKPISLVVFDLDHFKNINDTYGHPAGDAVLARIGQIANSQCRNGDMIARIGGEEFMWIMRAAPPKTARSAAERLRDAIEQHSKTDTAPAVTASVGYASWEPGDTSLTLFGRADSALYEAKNAGRNVIRMAA